MISLLLAQQVDTTANVLQGIVILSVFILAVFNVVWGIITICRKDEVNKTKKMILSIVSGIALILLFLAVRQYQIDLRETIGETVVLPKYMSFLFLGIEIIAECLYGFMFNQLDIKVVEENNEQQNNTINKEEIKKVDNKQITKENIDETKI